MNRTPRLLLAIFVLLSIPVSVSGSADGTTADGTLASSAGSASLETATFSMYCYWTGEATLGGVDGVVASRIGHWGGDEIVQVDYDPERTDLGTLIAALERQRSFDSVVVDDPSATEQVRDAVSGKRVDVHRGSPRFIAPKHSLRTRHPELLSLDLSESQAIALNHWSYFGGAMPNVLTAAQSRQLDGDAGAAP